MPDALGPHGAGVATPIEYSDLAGAIICIYIKSMLPITFDPAKRDRTLIERGLDFAEAGKVFAGETLTLPDRRREYGEPRFQTIGFLSGRMVMVVWTPRGNARHIISMRKCNEREQKAYRQQLGTG